MAHMFEHMAFKGSSYIGTKDIEAERAAIAAVDTAFLNLQKERLSLDSNAEKVAALENTFIEAQAKAGTHIETNEFVKIIDRFGGVGLNAGTAKDMTVYFYSLPSNKLELWMSLESERFADLVYREFYKERDVVKEERRMRTESSPFGMLIEELQSASYKAHPYGVPGIGHMSDLDNLTIDQAKAFYQKYYRPSNMTIALVGDLDPDEVIRLANLYFSRLPAGPKPLRIATVEPKANVERRVTIKGPAQPIATMAYLATDHRHPDWPVLEAISAILSDGRTSRLQRRLVQQEKAASFAGGFPGMPGTKYPTMFVFFGMPNKGFSNQQIIDLIDEEIEKIKSEPVSADELNRFKRKSRKNSMAQMRTNNGMAMMLAMNEVAEGTWKKAFDSLDSVQAVTIEDITRVANEVFVTTQRTVGFYENEEQGGQP